MAGAIDRVFLDESEAPAHPYSARCRARRDLNQHRLANRTFDAHALDRAIPNAVTASTPSQPHASPQIARAA